MKAAIMLLALLLGVGLAAAPAAAQEPVTVAGRLVNGTAEAPVPAGLPVLLHVLAADSSPRALTGAITGEQGEFQFENVTPEPESGYAISVEYQGVLYSIALDAAALGQPVELKVYEATQDISIVSVEQQVMALTGVNQRDQLADILVLTRLANRSDKTLQPDLASASAGQFSFLRFSLPTGSVNLDVQTDLPGGQVIPIGSGFAVTSPIAPGEHTVNFTYQVPYQGDTLALRQNFLQGAEQFQLLIPARFEGVSAAPLPESATVNIGGTIYRSWGGAGYAPGDRLELALQGLPEPGMFTLLVRQLTRPALWHTAIPAGLGAALAALLLYALWRPGLAAAPVVEAPGGRAAARRDSLIRAIAALDERFEQGLITEEEHRQRRERLKAALLSG